MASSIADLIYGNKKESSTKKHSSSTSKSSRDLPSRQSLQQNVIDNREYEIRSQYQYDAVDDYYHQEPSTLLSISASTAHASIPTRKAASISAIGEDTNKTYTQNELASSSQPSSTPAVSNKKRKKRNYDFQQNRAERDFFQDEEIDGKIGHAKLTEHLLIHGKRRRVYDESGKFTLERLETPQEMEERLLYLKERKKIRRRFRTKKYTLENETDVGGSVRYMLEAMHSAEKIRNEFCDQVDDDGTSSMNLENESDNSVVVSHKMESDRDEDHLEAFTGSSSHSPEEEEIEGRYKQENHVLGSLIDRIEEQNVVRREQQELNLNQKEWIQKQRHMIIYPNKDDPMDFQKRGLEAARNQDLKWNVLQPSSSDGKVFLPANKYFFQLQPNVHNNINGLGSDVKTPERKLSRKFISHVHKDIPGKGKKTIGEVVRIRRYHQSFQEKNGMLPMEYLTWSRYNSTIHYERNPEEKDAYFYMPTSFDHNPKSKRINMTKSHFTPSAMFGEYPKQSTMQRFDPLHLHTRNIMRLVARWIVGAKDPLCVSLPKSVDENVKVKDDEDSNLTHCNNSVSSNSHHIEASSSPRKTEDNIISPFRKDLVRFIRMLHRLDIRSTHHCILMRYSIEMARNHLLWEDIKDQLDILITCGVPRAKKVYESIRSDLLSSTSRMFTNPGDSTCPTSISLMSHLMRKKIYNYVQMLSPQDATSKKTKFLPYMKSHSIDKAIPVEDYNELPSTMGYKYSQVSHRSLIDQVTFKLTLGALLDELSMQRWDIVQHYDTQDDKIQNDRFNSYHNVHQMIMTYLETTEKTCWTVGNIHEDFVREVLSAPLAHTILAYQSYIANGDYIGWDLSDEDGKQVDWSQIAEELAKKFTEYTHDSRLALFSDVHITTGIATIAQSLPSYAADLLSQNVLENESVRTPIEIVRDTLEELERQGDLSRGQVSMNIFNGGDTVHVSELIESFNNAIDIFSRCMENDCDNFDAHLWFVATSIGAMCLGSGINLGEGAVIAAPSEEHHDTFLDFSTNQIKQYRDANYSALRGGAVSAFHMLINITETNTCVSENYYHHAVMSVLEWKEAVLLLAYRPHQQPSVLSQINSLHSSHLLQWSLKENSNSSIYSICALYEQGDVSKNELLIYLANMVEHNNESLLYWSALANALGPIGKVDAKDDLVGKLTWWENSFFCFTSSKFDRWRSSRSIIKTMKKALGEEIELIEDHHTLVSHSKEHMSLNNSLNILKNCSWTWSREPTNDDIEEIDEVPIEEEHDDKSINSNSVDVEKKKRCYDDVLPRNRKEHMIEQKGSKSSLYTHLTTNGPTVKHENRDTCRILGFKAIIASHLFGVRIPYVHSAVYYLARKACSQYECEKIQDKSFVCAVDSDEYYTLKWLAERGLDIICLCKDAEKHILMSNSNKKCPQVDYSFVTF